MKFLPQELSYRAAVIDSRHTSQRGNGPTTKHPWKKAELRRDRRSIGKSRRQSCKPMRKRKAERSQVNTKLCRRRGCMTRVKAPEIEMTEAIRGCREKKGTSCMKESMIQVQRRKGYLRRQGCSLTMPCKTRQTEEEKCLEEQPG